MIFNPVTISRVSSGIAAGICYLSLALPPLLFGSREPITIAIWCAVLGAGLVLASPRNLTQAHWRLLGGVALICLCAGFVVHEQLSASPWLASFNPVWAKASSALGKPIASSVSVLRGEPYFALGLPLANVLALVLGLIVGIDSRRASRGVHVLAWTGIGYAIYGIYALSFTPTEVLWRDKVYYVGSLTSTFINRNTAAAYFGACSVVWQVLLMARVRSLLPARHIRRNDFFDLFVLNPRREVVFPAVMMTVCLVALFLTNSRGGIFISLGVMIATFLIYFGRDLRAGRHLVLALFSLATAIAVLVAVMGGGIAARIRYSGLVDRSRLSVDVSTLNIIRDYPLFGTGLGTFAHIFPAYRSADISIEGTWDLAHNTSLQLAAEMGVPLTLLILIGWIVGMGLLAKTFKHRRRYMIVPLCAWSACLIGIIQSTIDFSFQIAGYSITMFALLGLGLSQALQMRPQFTKADALERKARSL